MAMEMGMGMRIGMHNLTRDTLVARSSASVELKCSVDRITFKFVLL
jgi:hypothetical protein